MKQETLNKSWLEVMDENVEVTENNTIDEELEDALGCLLLENPVSELNREEIRVVEVVFNKQTEEILTDEVIFHSVINPTAPKYVNFEEDDVEETNSISWIQAADVLNTFIKFPDCSRSFNDAEMTKLRLIPK